MNINDKINFKKMENQNTKKPIDWRLVLRDLKADDNTIPCYLILALIDSMYLTNELTESLKKFGYDLEVGLINRRNLDKDADIK